MATQEQIETFIGTITAHRDGLMVLYTSVEELEAIVANEQFIRDLHKMSLKGTVYRLYDTKNAKEPPVFVAKTIGDTTPFLVFQYRRGDNGIYRKILHRESHARWALQKAQKALHSKP